MALPPSTSRHSDNTVPSNHPLEEDVVSLCETLLPTYTSLGLGSSSVAEHVFHLHNRKGKPWATLTVKSAAGGAHASKNLPVFVEGRPIIGSVAMERGCTDFEFVKTVELVITGSIVSGAAPEESIPFLDHRTCLWPEPSNRDGSEIPASSSPIENGSYYWPFHINLPKQLCFEDGSGEQHTYRLPQTLMERNSPVGINYHIAVKVSRRRFHTDSKLITMVSFLNLTRPDPPSLLRQEAYRDHEPLLGPTEDPDGWEIAEPVNICGRVFGDRPVSVQCSLSLATPLAYTRGTTLPLSLSLSCSDIQALDLVSSPHAITVSLIRQIRYTDTPYSSSGRSRPRSPTKLHWKTSETVCGTACWWPVDGHKSMHSDSGDSHSGPTLQGEIKLSRYLQPTCQLPQLQVTYAVTLHPFSITGFQPSDLPHKPLVELPVRIATLPAKGPAAICYAPPEYADNARIAMQKLSSTLHWRMQRHTLGLVSGMM